MSTTMMMMKKNNLIVLLLSCIVLSTHAFANVQLNDVRTWKRFSDISGHLTSSFVDDFDGTTLDPVWYNPKEGSHNGGGNFEQQAYLPEQTQVVNGRLQITASYRPDQDLPVAAQPSTSNFSYPTDWASGKIQMKSHGITSGAVVFRGMQTASWRTARGLRAGFCPCSTCPTRPSLTLEAWWSPDNPLNGTDAWCNGGGEIDVVEFGWKETPDVLMQTVHTGDCWSDAGACPEDPQARHVYSSWHAKHTLPIASAPHDYGVAWNEYGLVYFLDDVATGVVVWATDKDIGSKRIPFANHGHTYTPIINLAMGGDRFAPLLCTPRITYIIFLYK